MDGNTSWKSVVVWDHSWLVVLLTMSSSHLELFISRPTEDSLFQIIKIRTGCQKIVYFYHSNNLKTGPHKTFD